MTILVEFRFIPHIDLIPEETEIVQVIFEKSEEIVKLEGVFWNWMESFNREAHDYHQYLEELQTRVKSPADNSPPAEVDEYLPKPSFHTFRHR